MCSGGGADNRAMALFVDRAEPLAVISDVLRIDWPMDDGSFERIKGEVVDIVRSKKEKHGSFFTYSVDIRPGKFISGVHKTRLHHLKWKKCKKRSVDTIGTSGVSGTETCIGMIKNNKYILAPMVGGSELAFRLLCRRYGTKLAYTPMINAERFANDEDYRREQFQTHPLDRPLVCHFGGNDPGKMLTAAKYVEHECDAIGEQTFNKIFKIRHFALFSTVTYDLIRSPIVQISTWDVHNVWHSQGTSDHSFSMKKIVPSCSAS